MGAPLYPVQYPLINGIRYDYSSITFMANNTEIVGITEIAYSQNKDPGEVYGSLAQRIGTTRGQLKAEASFTVLQLEYQNLINDLCNLNGTPFSGYMEARFDIQVKYQDGIGIQQGPLIVDILKGCCIKKADHSLKVGSEANAVKCDLDLGYILENGMSPLQLTAKFNSFVP